VRTVKIALLADVGGWMSGLGRATVAAKDFTGELNKAASGGKVEQITRATAGLGLGLVGVAGAAVKMAMDFDKSMSAVSAATHAPAATMDQLRAAAIQAGKDTQFSATQAADGITELAKAGVSTGQILGGGLKGALDLAAAGQISVGEAAETAASAMTQFRLSGDKVPHVADLLAAAAGKAQGSVHDVGAALNQSGLVASQFGLSIEDTTGALAEFANAGLIGSDAGTSFKTMLLAMANPTGVTQKKMDELGVSFYDAQGKFLGLSGVADMLQKRLSGLTEQERNAALGQIFGNDAIRAATILYKDGAKGVEKWAKGVNEQGYATDTAAKLTDNLAGDLERLKGSLETVAIESGGGATNGLRALTKGANGLVNAFADLPGWIQSTVTVMSALGGTSLLAMAGFLKARGTVKDFIGELRDIGPRGAAAAEGLGKIAGLAGRLGLVGAAVGGAFEAFQLFGNWALRKTAPVKANIDELTESMKQFAQTGQVTGELAAKYGDALQRIATDVSGVTKGMADLAQTQKDVAAGLTSAEGLENWNPVDPQAVQRIKDLDTALTGLVKNGGATQAAAVLGQLHNSGKLTATQYAQLISMLPNYTAATQVATIANGGLAKGFGTAGANAATMKSKLDDAIAAGQKMTDVWLQLNGALLSSNKAELAAAQAIDNVQKSFKENGKAIDESGIKYDSHGKRVKQNSDQVRANSEAALRNRIAVGDAAKAAIEAAQAKYEETGSVAKANARYNEYISQLRHTLLQAGLTKKQVDALIGSYGKMPDDVTTKVSITGNKDVAMKLAALSIQQAALKKGMPISTSAARALAGDEKAARQRGLFAGGGWTGPGDTYDEVGIVHADEHVIKKSSRRTLEAAKPGALDFMNETGRWPGYARGGRVEWPFPTTAAMTRIPSREEALSAIIPAMPGGGSGPGYKWMEAVVRRFFPGISVYSDYRPGAITVTGNRSYHAVGRAVDFAPSRALAEWVNRNYMAATRELITPWQSLNIQNGHRHTYSAIVEAGHDFAHGNAHDHWAMRNGGTITEPIFGVGASGRTYSFGENYMPERVTPGFGGHAGDIYATVYITAPVGSSPKEIGKEVASVLDSYCRGGGRVNLRGAVNP
jgi:TP901 family phage tail tape measure protein